jgi:hypothetical protein
MLRTVVVSALLTLSAFADVRAKVLGGVVSSRSGAVIGNAEVRLVLYDSNNQPVSTKSTRTDDTGHYTFRDVDARALSLRVAPEGTTPKSQTFITKTATPEVLIIDITLE